MLLLLKVEQGKYYITKIIKIKYKFMCLIIFNYFYFFYLKK